MNMDMDFGGAISKALRRMDKALGAVTTALSMTEPGSVFNMRMAQAEDFLSRSFDQVEYCAGGVTGRLAGSSRRLDDGEILKIYGALNDAQRVAVLAFMEYLQNGCGDSEPEIIKGFDACIHLMAEAFAKIEENFDNPEARLASMEHVFIERARLTRMAEGCTMAGVGA